MQLLVKLFRLLLVDIVSHDVNGEAYDGYQKGEQEHEVEVGKEEFGVHSVGYHPIRKSTVVFRRGS